MGVVHVEMRERDRIVVVQGRCVPLGATGFRILSLLASRPGTVFSREEILDRIHTGVYAIAPRSVDVQVCEIRQKLGPSGSLIETVRGRGYCLRKPTDRETAS